MIARYPISFLVIANSVRMCAKCWMYAFCRRREQEVKYRYRYRYGVELSEIRPKPECCEVCGQDHPKIVLDHCHETGAFRGWLCDPCNVVLGLVKDSADRLDKLAQHLRQPEFSNYVNLVKIQSNGLRKG